MASISDPMYKYFSKGFAGQPRIRGLKFRVQDLGETGGLQYRPPDTIVLIGTPKMVSLISGNSHLEFEV